MKCPFRRVISKSGNIVKKVDFEYCYESGCAAWGVVGYDVGTNLEINGCMMARNNAYAYYPGFGSCSNCDDICEEE